jgi:Sec-independent protein translocase protein TatA
LKIKKKSEGRVEFLNIGPWEIVVILFITIMVAGPERMVKIARKLGQYSHQWRQLSNEFLSTIQAEVDLADQNMSKTMDDVKKSTTPDLSASSESEEV